MIHYKLGKKQTNREKTNKNVTVELTAPTSYVFANDDGSVRTYSGYRMVFDRFKRRHDLDKYNIHFHGLRHTFSNMLFEMNENPKVIQQLLGKTTITVYNSVNSDYVREATDRLNTKIQEKQKEQVEEFSKDEMTDEEIERQIRELEKLQECKRLIKEKDFEM